MLDNFAINSSEKKEFPKEWEEFISHMRTNYPNPNNLKGSDRISYYGAKDGKFDVFGGSLAERELSILTLREWKASLSQLNYSIY